MQSKKVITGAKITAPSLSPVANSVIALVDLFPFSQSGTACLEPVRARACMCVPWHEFDLIHFHLYLSVSDEAPPRP